MNAKAVSYIVFGCILIGLGPFFVEFSGVDAMTSSFYRMVIGAAAFLLFALWSNDAMPEPRFLALYFFAGLMITLDLVACNQSILFIGSGLSTILSNLEVVFLLLLGSIFFHEQLPRLFLRLCCLMLVGICCLMQPYFLEIHTHQFWGIVFAVVASFIYSVYLLLLKLIRNNNPTSTPATTLGVVCLFGSLILGTFMAWHPSATFYLPGHWQSIFCVLAYSILSQVIGWWFITNGLKYVSLSVSGVLFLTQPALTFICDCLLLGRNTHWLQLLGAAIFLVTVYLTVQQERRIERENERREAST